MMNIEHSKSSQSIIFKNIRPLLYKPTIHDPVKFPTRSVHKFPIMADIKPFEKVISEPKIRVSKIPVPNRYNYKNIIRPILNQNDIKSTKVLKMANEKLYKNNHYTGIIYQPINYSKSTNEMKKSNHSKLPIMNGKTATKHNQGSRVPMTCGTKTKPDINNVSSNSYKQGEKKPLMDNRLRKKVRIIIFILA